jgi:uncharacterized Ntn-hydrolase superfamily protein
MLAMVAGGSTAEDALSAVLLSCEAPETRQLAIVTAEGAQAAYTGSSCLPWKGHSIAPGVIVAGNILAQSTVLQSMLNAFQTSARLQHADRLLLAVHEAQAAGGDIRGLQSAALLVRYRDQSWQDNDVRVDDHKDPLIELARLVKLSQQYAVLDDPDIKGGRAKLDGLAGIITDSWPEEVRFWLGVRLAELKRPAAKRLLDPLLRRDPWMTLWLRLQNSSK